MIVSYWLRENAKGLLLALLLFVAISAPFLLVPPYLASPISSREQVQGEIATVAVHPTNPKVAVGRGFNYEYGVRLSDGRIVYASGPISRPHAIGDIVVLTESLHENGRASYRFADAPSYW